MCTLTESVTGSGHDHGLHADLRALTQLTQRREVTEYATLCHNVFSAEPLSFFAHILPLKGISHKRCQHSTRSPNP